MADKEKLIWLLCNAHSKSCEASAFDGISYAEQLVIEADFLLENGITFAKDTNVPTWIPVTERLPEDDLPKDSKVKQIKVFVAYKTNGRWVTRTQTRVKGHWYGAPDEWDWVKVSDPNTHWMPLPEPPGGKAT